MSLYDFFMRGALERIGMRADARVAPLEFEKEDERMGEEIKLGSRARDAITGFEGVVVAITDWLYGCRRITIQPERVHEGKPLDTHTFDEPQVQLVAETAVTAAAPKTGGPRPEPRRHRDVG